jgi:hypothetical protein
MRMSMNQRQRNAALALTGLVALGIYIVACSSSPSFSPDDTKVLYPARDPATGLVGMSVYDRETRKSEMLYVVGSYEAKAGGEAKVNPVLFRGQWLPNGKEVVMVHVDVEGEGPITLCVMPWPAGRPSKTLVLGGKAGEGFLMAPLCVAGERLFYCTEDDEVARVDLRTFDQVRHRFKDVEGKLMLFPTPDGKGVFYGEQKGDADEKTVFGRLNPEDFSRTPLMVITNHLYDETVGMMKGDGKTWTAVAYDQQGKLLVCLNGNMEGNKGRPELVVWREGKVAFSRSVDMHSESVIFGNAALAASGKAVWATYERKVGTNATSLGLIEIPFGEERPRDVTLIEQAPAEMAGGVFYMQAAISHDGKTAAVASTYLGAGEKGIKPEDCALFFVDLSDPKLKVSKVPIPVPARLPELKR